MGTSIAASFLPPPVAFVEGYYIVGLLADAFLAQYGPQRIVHDPRLTWNTRAMTEAAGGEAVQSRTGHAFIKTADARGRRHLRR